MLEDRNWDDELRNIPQSESNDSIRLTYNELCMLDQVIHDNPSEDMDGWFDFRLEVWAAIYRTIQEATENILSVHGIPFSIPEDLQRAFMMLVPTTGMYGGDDCAFSLKFKIASKLMGLYVDPKIQQDIDDEEERLAKEKADADANKASDQAQGTTSDES